MEIDAPEIGVVVRVVRLQFYGFCVVRNCVIERTLVGKNICPLVVGVVVVGSKFKGPANVGKGFGVVAFIEVFIGLP